MRTRLWQNRLLVAAFALAAAATLFFAVRLVVFTLYWSDPTHREIHVEPWMTVGYVARSWGLKPQDLNTALGLPPSAGRPRPIGVLADEAGVPVEDLVRRVETAAAAMAAERALK